MSFKNHFNTYEFESDLPGSDIDKTLKFKPIRTKEIKKLLAYENVENYREVENVLDEMIKLSVIDEDFNVDDLYLQDRFYLLTDIRKKSKGENVEFEYKCPECESQTYISFNLDSLETKKLDNSVDNKIQLTDTISIYIWYITRGLEKEAIEKSESDNINSPEVQFNIITQGIQAVETPDGKEENLPFEDKQFIVDNMTTGDLDKLKNWYEKNHFGLDFRIEKKCKQCGHKEYTEVPLHNFFF